MGHFLIAGGTSGIGLATKELCESATVFGSECDVRLDAPPFPEVDHLDGLVYCPGTLNLKPFAQYSEQDFRDDWEINFLGAMKTIKHYLPVLSGSIVLVSTVAVQTGLPFHTSVAAAKGAVEGAVRSLAAELAPKIRVNGVAPSLTETKLSVHLTKKKEEMETKHPLKRLGKPEEVAQLIHYLLSAENVTGQIIHIDGGLNCLRV